MKRLTVEPRSQEWHDVRNDSWTASTAAMLCVRENAEMLKVAAAAKGVVLDIAPLLALGLENFYNNTPWRCWAEKTGRLPRFQGNEHTARGQKFEPLVIDHFESDQVMLVEREVTALSSTDEWLLASFDALAPASTDPSVRAPNGFPVEAKAPAFPSRKKLFDSIKAGKLAIMGLPYYWCQVQHQMLVAEAPYAWFVACGIERNKVIDPKTSKEVEVEGSEHVVYPIVERVPRDEAFLAAYKAIAEFYHSAYILPFEEPPKLPSDLLLLEEMAKKAAIDKALHDADPSVAADLYVDAVRKAAQANSLVKELEKKLLTAADAVRAEGSDVVMLGGQVEVIYSSGTKTTSWQKVAAALAPDGKVPQEVIDANTSTKSASPRIKVVAS